MVKQSEQGDFFNGWPEDGEPSPICQMEGCMQHKHFVSIRELQAKLARAEKVINYVELLRAAERGHPGGCMNDATCEISYRLCPDCELMEALDAYEKG